MHIVSANPRDDDALARALLVVQRTAYSVEAELIGDDRIPLMHESARDLQNAPVSWLVAMADTGAPEGAAAWASANGSAEIDRLIVSPKLHRRGIGRALVAAVLAAAGQMPVRVASGRDNRPARALYEAFGFDHVVDEEVLPRLWLSRYRLAR